MKSLFPATYSTLCPTALSALVSYNYKIGKAQCQLLVRGVGDTYLVETAESRFILRVYRSSHRSLPQIKEEVQLLLALKLAEVSVSYPVPDASGEFIQLLGAIEGERYAVLFTYAPGRVVRTMNENQLSAFGREVARFHKVSSAIKPGHARWNFDPETTLFGPLERLVAVFEEDPEGYNWLKQAAGQIGEKLLHAETSAFSKGYCHFDLLPKNFHFEGDSVTIFDFDFMGYGWLVNDIMSFWQHLSLEVYASRMTQDAANRAYTIFLDGYHEYRDISGQELALVPCLSLGFWLFYMGFHTTHDQFYAFIQPAHLKVYTGFLKYLAETHEMMA